jgi:hypothetical protein
MLNENDLLQVILLGHHPIGGADYIVSQSRWYQTLVVDYSDIIVLQPTGHTHVDEFRLVCILPLFFLRLRNFRENNEGGNNETLRKGLLKLLIMSAMVCVTH